MPVTNSFKNRFIEDPEECYLPDNALTQHTFESLEYTTETQIDFEAKPAMNQLRKRLKGIMSWIEALRSG